MTKTLPMAMTDREIASGRLGEIVATLELYIVVCGGLLALYACGRRKKSVYFARVKHCPRRTPPLAARDACAWWSSRSRVDRGELRRCVGLDAYFVLRFLALCRKLFLGAFVAALVTLAPAYATGAGGLRGFYAWTLGNCWRGASARAPDARLWGAVAYAYGFAAAALMFLTRESRHYLALRLEYLRRGEGEDDDAQPRCSVIVERVPPCVESQPYSGYGST